MFDSFGFEGLKEFKIQNVRKIIISTTYGVHKFNKKDKTINLTLLKFSIVSYKTLNTLT